MQVVVWASRLHSCPPSHHSLKKNLPKTENKSKWGPAVSPWKLRQPPKPPPNSRHEITTRKDDFQTLNSSVSFPLHNCAIAMATRPPASVSIIHERLQRWALVKWNQWWRNSARQNARFTPGDKAKAEPKFWVILLVESLRLGSRFLFYYFTILFIKTIWYRKFGNFFKKLEILVEFTLEKRITKLSQFFLW